MKSLTVRLPDLLLAEIESESRGRHCSMSDVIRERLQGVAAERDLQPSTQQPSHLDAIADLIGSVDGLPSDLGSRKKHYLKATGYGQNHSR